MIKEFIGKNKKIFRYIRILLIIVIVFLFLMAAFSVAGFFNFNSTSYNKESYVPKKEEPIIPVAPALPGVLPLDKKDYDARMLKLANIPVPPVPKPIIVTKKVVDKKTGKTTLVKETLPPKPVVIKPSIWPAKNTVYPNDGALLPFHRIVAYYGNLYSKNMGALGQYPEDEMLSKLMSEVKKWNEADPNTPVVPALHYVAVTAQGYAGSDKKYRLRMPSTEIDKIIKMADKIHAIVFLDVQVALSNLPTELPLLEKYLKMPNVHLGIDPEFSMKTGARPGTVVGSFDASDINYAAEYLAKLVKENNLTPKVLIVHRYTQKMVTNYQNIKPLPEVQVVMDMDGWGSRDKKLTTYKSYIYKEPVQFTGFKLFYKNDLWEKGTTLMTPPEVLKLSPQPIYIQYQ